MILINVLALVAVATAAVMLMLTSETGAMTRAIALREATQAAAIARGGEASAIVALRRDMLAAPDTDDRTEAWAKVAQARTPIEGGSFALKIADAQARFNVNGAVGSGEPTLAAIGAALGLAPDAASRIAGSIVADGPVADLAELRRAGVDAASIARLRSLVTALPGVTPVNVNAASAGLLGVFVSDPAAGLVLASRRHRAGRLTATDFAAAGMILPASAGFTSDHYLVTTTVTIGATMARLTSLIERRPATGSVVVLERWQGAPPS